MQSKLLPVINKFISNATEFSTSLSSSSFHQGHIKVNLCLAFFFPFSPSLLVCFGRDKDDMWYQYSNDIKEKRLYRKESMQFYQALEQVSCYLHCAKTSSFCIWIQVRYSLGCSKCEKRMHLIKAENTVIHTLPMILICGCSSKRPLVCRKS